MSLPEPYYQRGAVTIYHGDCLQLLPLLPDGAVDCVISDPPYGMDWNTDSKRFSGGNRKRGSGRDDWGDIAGDSVPFDPAPWIEFPRCVLWGANHYASKLPTGTTLVWLKKADHLFGTFLSDAEIGWMKGGYGVYAFRKQFSSFSRMAENGGTVAHPTQKPISLMEWCIEKASEQGDTILDPYLGSGTTAVAAIRTGRQCIGIELEERYCEITANRCDRELDQGRLPFDQPAAKPERQGTLFESGLDNSPSPEPKSRE